MPGFLLHVGATVMCTHGGQAQPTVPNPRVKVGGQPVVTTAGALPWPAARSSPACEPGPCVTAQWVTAATRVLAGGAPVLLQDSQAICVPTGTPLKIVVTQVRVKGTLMHIDYPFHFDGRGRTADDRPTTTTSAT